MSRIVTIKDIAKALNLSKSTVSRALRDRYDINPETRKAVLEMARKMDYRPNKIAQSLKKRRTNTIGVIIPSFTIPFYSYAISGIQGKADSEKYDVLICQSNESYQKELSCLETLLSSQVDGIILSLSRDTGDYFHLQQLVEKSIPIVLFNRVAYTLKLSKVTVDDYHGARTMVEHLLDIGKRRIAHITGPLNLQMARNRRKGYLDALAKAGIKPCDELIIEGDFTIENGVTCCKQLLNLSQPPDAIFCVCDAMAFGVMMEIKKQGLTIPDDIAVGGFTNEHVAPLVDPPLTTISQPVYEIGQNAAELLIHQINNQYFQTEHRELKTNLIIRGSTIGIHHTVK